MAASRLEVGAQDRLILDLLTHRGVAADARVWEPRGAPVAKRDLCCTRARSSSGRLARTRRSNVLTMRHSCAELSHFVFPDCESSPRCAANLVFSRCMRMNPLAPPAGGAFFTQPRIPWNRRTGRRLI